MSLNSLWAFLLIFGLELMLGIDNVVVLSTLTHDLPGKWRIRAQYWGMGFGLLSRMGVAVGLLAMLQVWQDTILWGHWSLQSVLLLLGGGWLIANAIHSLLENSNVQHVKLAPSIPWRIAQIAFFDLLFSIDSLVSALAISREAPIILLGIMSSVLVLLSVASHFSRWMKEQALVRQWAYLLVLIIGVFLFTEAFEPHLSKSPMYSIVSMLMLLGAYQLCRQKRSP